VWLPIRDQLSYSACHTGQTASSNGVLRVGGFFIYWNEDSMHGCQIGTSHPILPAE
jgi:hypothetical protein